MSLFDVNFELSELDQLSVMQDLVGVFYPGQNFCNPLKVQDKHPGARLEWNGDTLWLVDFGFEKKLCNVIDVYMIKHRVTYKTARLHIYQKYIRNKPVSLNSFKYARIPTMTYSENSFLDLYPTNWADIHEEFWAQYGLTKFQVTEFGKFTGEYFPVSHYSVSPGRLVYPDIGFGTIFESGRRKVYCPYSQNKWRCNTSSLDVYCSKDMRYDVCILGASFKDCATLYPWLEVSFRAFQSESVDGPVEWAKNFRKVIILYDSDEAGARGALQQRKRIPNSEVYSWVGECKDVAEAFQINPDEFFTNVTNLKNIQDGSNHQVDGIQS